MQPLLRPTSLAWAALACCLFVGCGSYSFLGDSRPYTGSMSNTTTHNGEVHRIVAWGDGGHGYRFEWKGSSAPELSADDTQILPLDEGEFIVAEYEGSDDLRRVELRPDAARAYFVDGVEQAYEPEGARWVAEVIPVLIDRLGFGASSRVPRILESDGVDGVLADIDKRSSDMARSEYYEVLLASPQLVVGEVTRVIEHASERVDSDAHLADLLEEVADSAELSGPVMTPYLEALASIDSDAHASDILEELVSDKTLADGEVARVLSEAVPRVSSDAHLSDILEEVHPDRLTDPTLRAAFVDALDGISSDAHAADVLEGQLDSARSPQVVASLLQAAAHGISSDAHMADVLEHCPASSVKDPSVADALRSAYATIASSSHREDVRERFPVGTFSE